MKCLETRQGEKPIYSWCPDLEREAEEQAHNLAKLPFTFSHVALMPDCHVGFGMPIGGVLATQGAIIPNAVGVDIGCGMLACKTTLEAKNLNMDAVKKLFKKIREKIPVGFKHRKRPKAWRGFNSAPRIGIVQQQLERAAYQLGTLGGGNHFIEVQVDEIGIVWFMIHSGSRNVGYQIANDFHLEARMLCERYYSDIPNKDLAFLSFTDLLYKQYYDSMNFAVAFAKENRAVMMEEVVKCALDCFGVFDVTWCEDVAHNYARMENHYGKNVMIHRKGAISAKKGEIGIIPGSQGTNSYITEGLGEKMSFSSSSHGAGRLMGRSQAKTLLDLEEQVEFLDEKGIVHSVRSEKDLDEAPRAYKNIEEVMDNQKDLVKVVFTLRPIGVIKG